MGIFNSYKNVSEKRNSLLEEIRKTNESIKQAERKTKVPHSNISKCLSKERDYAGGFFWVKKGERPNVKKMKNVNINSLVLDLNTGVFYNSSREVSELYGIKYVTLWRYLTGKRKNKTNFEYV